ncbi:MAG: ATP-binding protein [Deltaproteobacteria bacterium]|nr:ATP-binding protein [Deltaproteobacteria bacterium]
MKKTWPAVSDSVPAICLWVFEAAREAGFSEREAERWVLAVEEVAINIVHYAYPDGTAGTIAVEIDLSASAMTVRIADSGRPFNPLAAPEPDIEASLAAREIGGLGIYLARKVVDHIHYERRDEENILALSKQLPKNVNNQ